MAIPDKKINNKTCCIILFMLGLILISPVIDVKLIPGHDYIFHVSRIEAVAEALKHGVFPVRMYVDSVQFWGAPVGIFYPGLFNYVPALLKLAGVPIELCYNIYIALIVYLGLFASWYGFTLLARSKPVGLLSSALYISSGYYLFDAYMRNALGELLSLSFMPLAIACVVYVIKKNKVPIKIYLLSILSITAIIESHVLNSAFLSLFFICYIAINYKSITLVKSKKICCLAIIIFVLNATFIIPFLFFYKEVPLTVHFINDFAQNGVKLSILFRLCIMWNTWVVIGLYIFISRKILGSKYYINYRRTQFRYYTSFFIMGIFFLFASSTLFPWNYLAPLRETFKIMQFPWRFLGYASLCLSICGGFGLYLFLKKINLSIKMLSFTTALICIFHLLAFTYLTPTTYYGNWDMVEKRYWIRKPFYSDEDYLYRGMDAELLYKQGNQYITEANISEWQKELTNISFTYNSFTQESNITLPLINYPGYIATNQDDNEIPITENNNHMMVITLPKGSGTVKIHYEPKLFKIADYISVIACTILIYSMYWINSKKKWLKKY